MSLITVQQVYLFCDLLHYHQPGHTLRSSSQLYQPATRINFQSKAFSIMAPAVWNSNFLLFAAGARWHLYDLALLVIKLEAAQHLHISNITKS